MTRRLSIGISANLPELSEQRLPAANFVRRAVRNTLIIFAGIIGLALLVAGTVSIDLTAAGSGTLEPLRIRTIHSSEGGVVARMHVATGDNIEVGDTLAELESIELEMQLAQLEFRYQSALLETQRQSAVAQVEVRREESSVARSEAAIIRARAMVRQRMADFQLSSDVDSLLSNYVPGQHTTLDLAVADVLSAQADHRGHRTSTEATTLERFDKVLIERELDRLKAEIDWLEARIARFTLRSSARGVVLTADADQLVGSRLAPGDILLQVAELTAWRAVLWVHGRDVHQIDIGDKATIQVEALGDRSSRLLSGKVAFVAPQALQSGQPGVVSPPLFRVEVELDETQLAALGVDRFRKGYSARGTVTKRSGLILSILLQRLTRDSRFRP